MDKNITPERFNALSFQEQVAYLVKEGEIITTDEHVTVYRLFDFQVRMHMKYKPLRISSLMAVSAVKEEA